MTKKIFMVLAMTLVVAFGVLGVVKTTYAQEIESPGVADEAVVTPIEATYEYENAYQFGDRNGEGDPILTQTRTRSRLGELQDGECTGDGEQQQLRLHVGEGNQGEMRQQQYKLNDGSCTGDCVQIRQNGRGH